MTKQIKSKGFTIVELLIVIVVIAILAAITIVAYNGIQQRAHTTSNKTAAENLAKKMESYNAVQNTYPQYNTAATFGSSTSAGYLNSVTDSSLVGSGITVSKKSALSATSSDGTVGVMLCTGSSPAAGAAATGYVLYIWDSTASPAAAIPVQAGGNGAISGTTGSCGASGSTTLSDLN